MLDYFETRINEILPLWSPMKILGLPKASMGVFGYWMASSIRVNYYFIIYHYARWKMLWSVQPEIVP